VLGVAWMLDGVCRLNRDRSAARCRQLPMGPGFFPPNGNQPEVVSLAPPEPAAFLGLQPAGQLDSDGKWMVRRMTWVPLVHSSGQRVLGSGQATDSRMNANES
jgi:hypothetical protein